jgi:beta-galactosidase
MIKLENNKFIIGKEEYYPFSAEFHYFRVNKRFWSVCFERIRKAGFKIVSTSVPWNLHESASGEFDFAGETDQRKDLIVFLELSREFGFKVILKPGPYIGAEWENGGYPQFIFENPEILAKDFLDQPIQIIDNIKTEQGLVPSYHHPLFKSHFKRYLTALAGVIKNYIYPKGPVFLIQLDNELSFAHNFGPFQADYNEYTLNKLFPEFLKGKYQDIKELNGVYKGRHKSFEEIKAPRELKLSAPEDLTRYFDWLEFKENCLTSFLKELNELFISLEVPALFSSTVSWTKNFFLPLNWQSFYQDKILLGVNIDWEENYLAWSRFLRGFAGCAQFSWASLFPTGRWSDSPEEGKKYFPVDSRKTKFILTTCLSSGIKGFSHYMFVERDHWYDSPLANDGAIQPNYEIVKKFNFLVEKINLNELKSFSEISLVNYRPYLWYNHLSDEGRFASPAGQAGGKINEPFAYLNILLEKTHPGLSQDFSNLKYDYRISDLGVKESLEGYKIFFVPCAEFMDSQSQSLLVELAKKGRTIVLFGLLPKWDEKMKNCDILANALKAKTKNNLSVETVEGFEEEFPSILFGHIKSSRKAQVVAESEQKPVGALFKVGKGQVWLFTFDISSQLCHQKLSFLEKIIRQNEIFPCAFASDPEIGVVVQKNNEAVILYLLNPRYNPPQTKGKNKNPFILQLNCKKLGIKGEKIKLTDLLGEEVIKTSSSDLKKGIVMTLGNMDSRMFLVEGK